MVQKLRDVMGYLCSHYAYPGDLSKARLTKLVYLADWRMSILQGRQITSIEWVYNHYGPYVKDVSDLARFSADFVVRSDVNAFGSAREVIDFVGTSEFPELAEGEVEVLDHVISSTQNLNFADFLNLVYSTYPVDVSEKFSHLDLPAMATAYKSVIESSLSDR